MEESLQNQKDFTCQHELERCVKKVLTERSQLAIATCEFTNCQLVCVITFFQFLCGNSCICIVVSDD